jgi:predicted acetyltransferase
MKLELVPPAIRLRDTFLAGLDELAVESERSAWLYLGPVPPPDLPRRDFAAYVELLLAREHTPPPRFVTDNVYWALRDGEMVGRISLRHELTESLLREGGHTGYVVRPSARRQGIATEMLRQILLTEKARAIGRLLVTCDEDNLASEKSIRKNGGILENVLELEDGRRKKRFWISLR